MKKEKITICETVGTKEYSIIFDENYSLDRENLKEIYKSIMDLRDNKYSRSDKDGME